MQDLLAMTALQLATKSGNTTTTVQEKTDYTEVESTLGELLLEIEKLK